MSGLNVLNAISGIVAFVSGMVIISFFIESRFPRNKTILFHTLFLAPLCAFDLAYYGTYGSERGGQAFLLINALPGLLFYWFLSKHRDGRIFFSYFCAHSITGMVIMLTNIPNTYLTPDTYLINFFGRLILCPLVCYVAWRWVREPFQRVLHGIDRGWGSFAFLTGLYYLVAILMFNYPTAITSRPAELPAMLLYLAVGPLTYYQLFRSLLRQQELYESRDREAILQMQVAMVQQRVEQTARAEELLSIQRHDLRHRFRTLDALLEQGDTAAAREYVATADRSLAETVPRRWCRNPTLNAMFAVYLGAAEAEGIRVEADLDIPPSLDADAAELSTAFANALENAVTAVKELPGEERVIRVKAIHQPQIMFKVSNPYRGKVSFDEEGRPAAKEPGHGLGIHSIEAYCEKHNAFCEFKAENGWFEASIVHM